MPCINCYISWAQSYGFPLLAFVFTWILARLSYFKAIPKLSAPATTDTNTNEETVDLLAVSLERERSRNQLELERLGWEKDAELRKRI